ncbi:nuclear pore complex component-domain-containing protein [Yarrowia lipolytica]|jgi:nucleoporin POM34|nr:hypothetical protein YALI1_D23730g [Yarrowia lipolytica]KAB8279819.1 nuclear pore complex component-domain-containing protein [Yarrowia lipolytica]KAE8170744.1 nuclear pore complex component-domain-containing protein [Yarrowia lipolytica]RDW26647.1 nuclear pore complex component-domain-containing protein [Yarrowia lipolytica]RDW29491.1 nuclear pore complex component-domain-containing protein [Yarrowia lipolytica]
MWIMATTTQAHKTLTKMDQSPFTRRLYEAGTLDDMPSPTRESTPGNVTSNMTTSLPSTPKHYQFRESASGVNFKASPVTPKAGFTPKFGGPSTPNRSTQATPQGTPTGSWTHPSLKVVKQRSGISKEAMVKRVVYNALSWLVFVLFRSFVKRVFFDWIAPNDLIHLPPDDSPTWKYVLYLQYFIQGVLATNILQALFYLVQPQDKYADLPMTDEQRELMGLPKLNKKTDIKNVPTPPKYVRNSPGSMNFPSPKPRSRSNSTSSSSVGTISASPGNSSVDLGNLSLGPSASPLRRHPNHVVSNVPGIGTPSPLGKSGVNVAKTIQSTGKNSAANTTANMSLSQSTPIGTPKNKSKLNQSQSFTPTGRYMYYSDSPRKA